MTGASASRNPPQAVALACASQSISMTRRPATPKATARCVARVVLPDPPLRDSRARTRKAAGEGCAMPQDIPDILYIAQMVYVRRLSSIYLGYPVYLYQTTELITCGSRTQPSG